MTLGNDNGTDGQTDRWTDRVRRNMRPPPREEGRIITPSWPGLVWSGLRGDDPLTTVRLSQRSLSSQLLGK